LSINKLTTGVHFAEYNDVASAESVINEKTCAVIVEPVQGEGGVTPADPHFLRSLRALCDKFNALLVVDEVQWYIEVSATKKKKKEKGKKNNPARSVICLLFFYSITNS
jgi:acetylornithine/succinyldiaminopimelate/putrescine aminotransferase